MEKINFNALDDAELYGLLFTNTHNKENDIKNKDIILSVHGMASNCFKKRDEEISIMANKNKIDYFCFNNRGSELVKYITINGSKHICGTTFENPLDGYSDIVGAIHMLKNLGYTNIHLLGHSLGCTKIVYTYNKLLEENSKLIQNISSISLLSLVDIPMAIKVYLNERYKETLECAMNLNKADLLPANSFIHPISAGTFLSYTVNNHSIDFAKYGRDNKMEALNNIKCPLFMRWGNKKDMIMGKAEELSLLMNHTISNTHKDISIIDGADHGYTGVESIVAEELLNFIKTNNNN